MRRYWFPKTYADLVAKLRVPSGFLLVAAFAYFAAPDATSLGMGIPVSIAGLLLRAWAAGHLAKNRNLATSGPYAYSRNPLYVGTLLVAAGLVIASQRWLLAALFGGVFLLIYLPVIELEEQHLRKLFPDYGDYAAKVPMLLPLGRLPSNQGFQRALYIKNQEYQALAGYLLGLLLLVWKAGLLTGTQGQ
ncbi:MAG: isoprenylcysteine carboxylmethyltransferase family protein [Bryobacteraceae bacterium]